MTTSKGGEFDFDAFTANLAEQIVKQWRSFDTAPNRATYKEVIRIGICHVINKALITVTQQEFGREPLRPSE